MNTEAGWVMGAANTVASKRARLGAGLLQPQQACSSG